MSIRHQDKERLYTIEDLEHLLEYIPYEIWLKDKDGKHVYINKKGADKLGLKKEDIIGKTDMEIRPKEIWEKCDQTDKQVIEDKKPLFYEDEFDENQNSYYRVYKFPIKDSEDNIILNGGMAKEVTYSKYIDNELEVLLKDVKKSEDIKLDYVKSLSKIITNLNKMIKSSSIDLFFINKSKDKLSLTISCKNKKVFLENSSININYQEFSENYNNNLYRDIENELNNELKKIYNNRVKINDNSIFKIIPLKIDDDLIGIMHIYYEEKYDNMSSYDTYIYDIVHRINSLFKNLKMQDRLYKSQEKFNSLNKEIKILEEAIETEIVKVNFLENMSHEFKTPINVILMISKLLLSFENGNFNLDKEKRIQYLNTLKQNSYRILRLVNNILDSTSLEKRYKELEMNNYNIISIIEDIVLYSAQHIKDSNKSIIFDTEEEEVILACNPNFIEKIILNLISNALKFSSDNGTIEIDIKVNKEEERLYVHLKNDGNSISNNDSKIIFNKFFQVENHIRRKNEGTGIGLYLVKCLIEAHDGDIWINTEVKSGVEFIFYIPIKKIDSEEGVKTYSIEEHSIFDKCNIEFSDIYL